MLLLPERQVLNGQVQSLPGATSAVCGAVGMDLCGECRNVAERAGNSVEVLLRRHAKCIDGRQETANRKTDELLREYE
ncbi:hypothetical protein [Streptomyces sp. NPDC052107]|uniref:hypothetical protein n=1 Tax=Streptomyces sp. NPDC052107 TaxID=3155632 RepID=UPI0034353BCB